MAQSIGFYQIWFREEHKKEIFPFASQFHNPTLSEFFENSIISTLVKSTVADKIAVCSWSLRKKMTMRIPPRRELFQEVLQEDFDVMSFSKNVPSHDMLGALEGWHPGCTEILKLIFANLSLPFTRKPKFPIYQNAFCAKSEIYKQYVTEFLDPAMELMATNERIKVLCWQDAGYTRTTLNETVDLKRIKELLGVPYYPLHPFLLERCFSLWIDNKNLKVIYL